MAMEDQAKLLADLAAAISSMNAKVNDLHPVVLELNQCRPGVERAVDALRAEVGDLQARVVDTTPPAEPAAGTDMPPLLLLSADAPPSSSSKPASASKPSSAAAATSCIDHLDASHVAPVDATSSAIVESAPMEVYMVEMLREGVPESAPMSAILQGSSLSMSIPRETLGVDPSACTGFITMAPASCSSDCLPQQPVPWPPFLAVHANGEEKRPLPWPSFRISYSRELPSDAVMKPPWQCTSDSSPATAIGDVIELRVSGYHGNLCTSTSCITIHDMCSSSELRCHQGVLLSLEYLGCLELKLLSHESALVTLPTVTFDSVVCQDSSVHYSSVNLIARETISGVFGTMDWHLLDFLCRSAVTVCSYCSGYFITVPFLPSFCYTTVHDMSSRMYDGWEFMIFTVSASFSCLNGGVIFISWIRVAEQTIITLYKLRPTVQGISAELSIHEPYAGYCYFAILTLDLHSTISWNDSGRPSDANVVLLHFSGKTHQIGFLLQGGTRADFSSVVSNKLWLQNHQDTLQRKMLWSSRVRAFVLLGGKCCWNWLFAHSASVRETLLTPLRSDISTYMNVWGFTTANLTAIVTIFSARISMQMNANCSVQPRLLLTHAYHLSILAPTMFSFACGNLDCTFNSWTTRSSLQVTCSEFSAWFSLQMIVACSTQQSLMLPHAYQLTCDPAEVSCRCVLISLNLHSIVSFVDCDCLGWVAHQAVFCKTGTELPSHFCRTSSTAIHQSDYEAVYNKRAWELAMGIYPMGHVREENSVTWLVVCSRLNKLNCTIFLAPGDPSDVLFHHVIRASGPCVTARRAGGCTDKNASSHEIVICKDFRALWDPGGHTPPAFDDTGLRASRMLRGGECHEPCGPLHWVAWAARRRAPQAQRTRKERCTQMYLKGIQTSGWGVDELVPCRVGRLFSLYPRILLPSIPRLLLSLYPQISCTRPRIVSRIQ